MMMSSHLRSRVCVLTFVLFVTRDGTTVRRQTPISARAQKTPASQSRTNLLFHEAATTRTCVLGFLFVAYLASSACFSRRRHASVITTATEPLAAATDDRDDGF